MNRKTLIQSIVLALSATLALGAAAQTAAPAKQKLVLQVSDGDSAKWNLALNNAKNVQQELGAGKVEIEIVAYGPGIGMLKADATTSNRISEAMQAGVRVVACETTMAALKLSKADLHEDIGFAPSGVVEIMRLQGQGWSYVRP